jgi:hemerythrin superfamily protein
MRKAKRGATTKRRSAKPQDAIALLKADHRQVEEWFEQFESTRSSSRKSDLAQKICAALTTHATIEEEIFYPAFLEATEEEDLHHEAEVEHDGAKKLIAAIEASGPDDDYFDARVTVLSEMIKHHVKEEEQRDGMFAKARAAGMDLQALGEQLAARKAEIESQGSSPRSRRSSGTGASRRAVELVGKGVRSAHQDR